MKTGQHAMCRHTPALSTIVSSKKNKATRHLDDRYNFIPFTFDAKRAILTTPRPRRLDCNERTPKRGGGARHPVIRNQNRSQNHHRARPPLVKAPGS